MAGLSVRNPLNEPCRTRLSRVQPRNAICATSFGSRKCALPGDRRRHVRHRRAFAFELSELRREIVEPLARIAAADPPGIAQLALLAHAPAAASENGRRGLSDGRQPMMTNSCSMPHLLFSQVWLRPETIGRVAALGDDALELDLAGVREDLLARAARCDRNSSAARRTPLSSCASASLRSSSGRLRRSSPSSSSRSNR